MQEVRKTKKLSDKAGQVIAACFSGEALATPKVRKWDVHQYSQGIAQWSQDRAERIKAVFGAYPKDMTVDKQVLAFLWECQKHYPKTWAVLTNAENTPERMMDVLVRDFERPKNPAKAVRERMKMFASIRPIPPPEKETPS